MAMEKRRPEASAPVRGKPVNGGACRDRTDDPLLAKQVLYQLSYIPSMVSGLADPDFAASRSVIGRHGVLSNTTTNHGGPGRT